MGLNDTAEQLEAAQAQSVVDEATIVDLRTRLDERRAMTDDLRTQLDLRRGVIADLERQNAELEHDLARAESALADRLQHDAHAHPTHATIDRGMVAQVFEDVLTVGGGTTARIVMDEAVDRIVQLVQPADGVLITDEEAALAIRAARHSAESIRAVLDVDPARLHPDVAPYVDRLTDLADRLTQETR